MYFNTFRILREDFSCLLLCLLDFFFLILMFFYSKSLIEKLNWTVLTGSTTPHSFSLPKFVLKLWCAAEMTEESWHGHAVSSPINVCMLDRICTFLITIMINEQLPHVSNRGQFMEFHPSLYSYFVFSGMIHFGFSGRNVLTKIIWFDPEIITLYYIGWGSGCRLRVFGIADWSEFQQIQYH